MPDMWPYWLLFLIPFLGTLGPIRLDPRALNLAWFGVATLFALIIGLRHQVGGDWGSYLLHLRLVYEMGIFGALAHGDPGYYFVNWLVAQLGGDIYWVNLVCGALVMMGVVTFARQQPLPWLALLVAVPYLIVVVSMGYTRQSVALGLALLGLAALNNGQVRGFVAWVVLGALFHKSAVLLLPIAALAASRRRLWNFFWVGVTAAVAAGLLVWDSSQALWANYVESGYESKGGLIRVAMNAVPAALFLMFHRYLALGYSERRLWWWMSVLALASLPLVPFASTAVDRVALYFIPLQMFVFSRLHLIRNELDERGFIILGVVGYYALVQWVWLNMATHAPYWLPYQFALFH